MTQTTERQQFAAQNEMSMEFVNWFFDEKKDGCGNAWFIMAAAMWEGWKGQAANREAQPVAYFAAAPDYGWDMFKNKEDAIATCQAEIDAYRDCRDDGWDDDVQRVCWGVVMQKAEGFDLQGLHTSNSNHTYQTCDYSLHPVTATAPPAPAVPEEMKRDPDADVFDPGFMNGWNACRAAMLAAAPEGGNG